MSFYNSRLRWSGCIGVGVKSVIDAVDCCQWRIGKRGSTAVHWARIALRSGMLRSIACAAVASTVASHGDLQQQATSCLCAPSCPTIHLCLKLSCCGVAGALGARMWPAFPLLCVNAALRCMCWRRADGITTLRATARCLRIVLFSLSDNDLKQPAADPVAQLRPAVMPHTRRRSDNRS